MAQKKSPLRPLIEQITEIVNIFYKRQKEGLQTEMPENLEKQLKEVQKGAEFLEKVYAKALEYEGVTTEEAQKKSTTDSGKLSSEDRKLLLTIGKLQAEVMAIQNALQSYLEQKAELTKNKKEKRRSPLQKRDRQRKRGWKKL